MKTFEPLPDKTIELFMKGDQRAFEKVYANYQTYISKLAYQFFSDEEIAKDIVQETFLKAYKSRKQLKSPGAIVTWIHKICYTCCLDTYRKSKVDSSGYTFDDASTRIEYMEVEEDENVIRQLHLEDAKEAVVAVIDELQPDYKTVAYLRFFEELKHKEIAEIMDMDVKAVGTYIQRSKALIIKKLRHRGFSESSCLTVITVPFLIEFYREFANSMPEIAPQSSTQLLKNSKVTTHMGAGLVLPYTLVIGSVLLTGGVIMSKTTNVLNDVLPVSKSTIEYIDYDKELTNEPIKVDVQTSNDNYDQILINNEATSTIKKNGEYRIELQKQGEIIDTQTVVITNIDRDIPIVINEVYDGDKVVLTIKDTDSGINYKDIQLLENDKLSSSMNIDEANATITIDRDVTKDIDLKIPDLAGNILNVNISFK